MFRKSNFISLGLAGLKYSPNIPSSEANKVEDDFSKGVVALGDSVPFEIRLAETMEWCVPRANILDPKNSLRSEELKPAKVDDLYNYDHPSYNRVRIQNVCKLLEVRKQMLRKEVTALTSASSLKGGRLLVYFLDETFWDGASECASMEFFDVYDAPAWDTWVGLYKDGDRHLCRISRGVLSPLLKMELQ